jgi:hypothetical protein
VFSRDVLNLLFYTTSTNVAGTAVPVTAEALGTAVPAGSIKTLKNKNGANTQVASISVSHG